MIHKMSLFLFLLLLTSLSSYAQLGVGTVAPEEAAVMDIVSSNRGLLIPRVGLKDLSNKRINGTDSPESLESTLIYNNGSATSGVTEKGFYYWSGSQWVRLVTTSTIDDLLAKTYTSSQVTTENLGNDDMLPLRGTFIIKASGVFGSEKTLDVELPKITADHHGLKYTIVSRKTSLQRKINVRVLPSDGSSDRIDGGSIPTSVITPRLLILQAEYVAGGTSRWHVIDRTLFKTEYFDKTIGGAARDECHSIIQTSDGGYALAGSTSSKGAGNSDVWLIKTDASGNKSWDKTFGGRSSDGGYSIIQTRDGGYALAGFTRSKSAGNIDFWLIKTDVYGNKQWDKTFGGSGSDISYSIIQTRDGGYALAGTTEFKGAGNYDFWLVKTDKDGNKSWDKTYGGSSLDISNSIVQTHDGGYALAGHTLSKGAGNYDFWLVKTDKDGNKSWDKTYGGSSWDSSNSIVQTRDGGYALAGYTSSKGAGFVDFWLVKTDKDGNKTWDKTFGGTANEVCNSIIQTRDGGYALVGYTRSKGAGEEDFWLVKTDKDGNRIWDRTFGGTRLDISRSVIQTDDDGYALSGHTKSKGAGEEDFWIVSYKP